MTSLLLQICEALEISMLLMLTLMAVPEER